MYPWMPWQGELPLLEQILALSWIMIQPIVIQRWHSSVFFKSNTIQVYRFWHSPFNSVQAFTALSALSKERSEAYANADATVSLLSTSSLSVLHLHVYDPDFSCVLLLYFALCLYAWFLLSHTLDETFQVVSIIHSRSRFSAVSDFAVIHINGFLVFQILQYALVSKMY